MTQFHLRTKRQANLFTLVLRALDIFVILSFSPFCFSLALLIEFEIELEILSLRDPEVDAVFGGSVIVAVADEVDEDEPTSVAVAVRARLWRSRSTRSSLMMANQN